MNQYRDDSQNWWAQNVGLPGMLILCLFAVSVFLACAILISVWWNPATDNSSVEFPLPVHINDPLMVLAAAGGALGAFVHLATSLTTFIGNRQLIRSWVAWYLLRPFIGAALGFLGYFVLRAGLITSDGPGAINQYGVIALSGLFGMFSKQAIDKLRELFDTLMHGSNEKQRADPLQSDV